LLERNKARKEQEVTSVENRISLPFIMVNTPSSTFIELEVSDDHSAYFFNFSQPFEIHDDSEIIKRLREQQSGNKEEEGEGEGEEEEREEEENGSKEEGGEGAASAGTEGTEGRREEVARSG
jgi:hypothetical protein